MNVDSHMLAIHYRCVMRHLVKNSYVLIFTSLCVYFFMCYFWQIYICSALLFVLVLDVN